MHTLILAGTSILAIAPSAQVTAHAWGWETPGARWPNNAGVTVAEVENLPDGCAPGWSYDGENFEAPALWASLEEAQTDKLSSLNREFQRARDAGVYVSGILIETTPQVQSEMKSLVARLTRVGGTQGIATRSGFVENVDLTMATVLHDGVEDYISAVWQRDADLTAQIHAAETIEDVMAIDITSGWPSRNEP